MTKFIQNDLILLKKILKSILNNNNNNNDNNNDNNNNEHEHEPIEQNRYNLIEESITIKDDNRDVLCLLETI
jgi:hypothetical protein